MAVQLDLSQILLDSDYPAFKNNKVYTGSVTLSGSQTAGTNTKTFTVALDQAPDMIHAVFTGRADPTGSTDPFDRPTDAWFKRGYIYVHNSGGTDDPWEITYYISGSNVKITATTSQQYTGTYTITSTTIYYRIVDYSVF